MQSEIDGLKIGFAALASKIEELQAELLILRGDVTKPNKHIRVYTTTQTDQSTPADNSGKSYKHPDLSFANHDIMLSLFNDHKEKLPYKLFRYIYFSVDVAANKTVKMPEKMSLNPRNINVCDYGDWHKAPAADVLIEINRIICELINTYLTKGELYDKMDLADKKIVGDIVCGRFDKKITQENIKNYMSALY